VKDFSDHFFDGGCGSLLTITVRVALVLGVAAAHHHTTACVNFDCRGGGDKAGDCESSEHYSLIVFSLKYLLLFEIISSDAFYIQEGSRINPPPALPTN